MKEFLFQDQKKSNLGTADPIRYEINIIKLINEEFKFKRISKLEIFNSKVKECAKNYNNKTVQHPITKLCS